MEKAFKSCDEASGLVVAGSSLTVYSAFRFVKYMESLGKPIVIVNVGATRADDGIKNCLKIEAGVGEFFQNLNREIVGSEGTRKE